MSNGVVSEKQDMALGPNTSMRGVLKGLLVSLVVNVGIPLLIIYLLTNYVHTSELIALGVASIVPIVSSVVEVLHNRRLDLIAVFFLLGALTSILALLLGGSVRLLIIRESFFSGALGLFCLVSLVAMPRPLMFYVGRQMLAGNDPVRVENFNASWQERSVRAGHRLITGMWGVALFGEFVVRVIIALTLPTTLAYGLGSAIFTIVLTGTFVWTFAYIRLLQKKRKEQVG